MSIYYDNSKLYSIKQLQLFFQNNIISPSSYISNLLTKTKKYEATLHSYISFDQTGLRNKLNSINELVKEDLFHKKVLAGIPFNIKDSFITKQYKTTYGVSQENINSDLNSQIVDMFENQAGILLGKTSIPAHAYDVQTFNDLVGITKNPWNQDYSSGGSTGGGATSVAIGLVPIAIGSDFAGSIRIPASFCGIKGYIPTHAGTFLAGHYPDSLQKEHFSFHVGQVGFLSNFYDDFREIYDILNKKNYQKTFFDLKSYSYTICLEDEYVPVKSEIKSKLSHIGEILQKERVEVSFDNPKEFSFKEVGKVHAELMHWTFSSTNQPEMALDPALEQKKLEFSRNLDAYLENKFWILPISATTAIKHNLDHLPIDVDSKSVPYWRAMIHYSKPFNIVDNPIATLPVGINSTGLPIGIQIVGPKNSDLHLLALAQFLELKIGSLPYPPGFDLN